MSESQNNPEILQKICPHYRMSVPLEASICAYCRLAIGGTQAAAQGIGAIISLAALLWALYYRWQGNQAMNNLLDKFPSK